jgi:hypothetical protein
MYWLRVRMAVVKWCVQMIICGTTRTHLHICDANFHIATAVWYQVRMSFFVILWQNAVRSSHKLIFMFEDN